MKNIGIDDAIIDAWVGTKNDMNQKVKNSNFNWCAFLFGGFYYIYRKMYLIGIVLIIIEIVLGLFKGTLATLLGIALWVVSGFVFYPLYINHIKATLLKNQHMNPIQVAQMKGGVNPTGLAIAISCAVVIVIVVNFVIGMLAVVYIGGTLQEFNDRMNGKGDSDRDYNYNYNYDYDDYDWNQLMKEYEIDFENDYNWDI